MIFEHGDRVVFAGDSVTDCGRKRPYGEGLWEGLGNGYVRQIDSMLSCLYPEKLIHITNVGESGATSTDMLAHWENNVEALKPDWVFFMIGANDVWRQFDEPGQYSEKYLPEVYRANLDAVCKRTVGKVKGLFILSPFYMESNNEDAMKKRMVEYANIAKEIAEKYGVPFVDLQKDFDEHLKHRYPAYISWDRVHPNWVGGMLIARRLMKDIIKADKLY
ncbi:MAG: SGNH/GDSL hydrolase family protein [Clostridia bacterium]|nr:SGNH/GDSL hydrolase family protein [Clostridia bacterium]